MTHMGVMMSVLYEAPDANNADTAQLWDAGTCFLVLLAFALSKRIGEERVQMTVLHFTDAIDDTIEEIDDELKS